MAKRPKPFGVGPARARAIRGPAEDGRWYWRVEDHRSRATVWTGWATTAEARERAVEAVAHHDERADSGLETVEQLLLAHIAHMEDNRPDLAPTSVLAYRAAARRVAVVAGSVRLEQLRDAAVDQLRAALLRSCAPGSAIVSMSALRAAWGWARPRGLCPDRDLPRVTIDRPKVDRITPTPTEISKAIGELGQPWARLLARLLWSTGARIGEVVHLERGRVHQDVLELHLRGKTGERRVPIRADLMADLVAHMATHDREAVLDATPGTARHLAELLPEACERAGVRSFTPHALRRAAVDALLRTGADVGTAAKLLGHTPEVMLAHYRQATPADVRDAVARARLGVLIEDGNVIELDRRR